MKTQLKQTTRELIIENIIQLKEDLDIKRQALPELAEHCPEFI